jgi:hypothetical protein
MTPTRIGVIAHGAAIGLLAVAVVVLLRAGQETPDVDGGGIGFFTSLIVVGLIAPGVIALVQWARRSPRGATRLLLFDLVTGGVAVLLTASWVAAATDPATSSTATIATLVWAVAVMAAVAVGVISIQRRSVTTA